MLSNISRRKVIFFFTFIILVIFLAFYFLFFYQKKENTAPVKQKIELTEKQIISNFKEINNYYKENPVSVEEKIEDLKKITEENSKKKPLTSEERAAIINSLKE
jgi:uncharacterized membrane protein